MGNDCAIGKQQGGANVNGRVVCCACPLRWSGGSGRVGGLAVTNGIRTPNAQGKTGSAFTARLVAVPGTCANDEKVINEVARTAASDNEADLDVSIVRFYSTHSCDVNLRNQQKKLHAGRIGASSERNGADAAFRFVEPVLTSSGPSLK